MTRTEHLSLDELHAILPAMARLNNWARVPYEQRLGMDPPIYHYKRVVIKEAIRLGAASLRVISVERPCKTCNDTGQYSIRDRYDYEIFDYEDCRRCQASGKVTLRFVESVIGSTRFHTPRPKWDLGLIEASDWEKPEVTDWTPEQPGAPIERLELIGLLNQVEAALLREIPWEPWHHRTLNYYLDLGPVDGCCICRNQTPESEYKSAIHRPAFKWQQAECRECRLSRAWLHKPLTWPASLQGPDERRDRDFYASHHRAELPAIAHTPEVTEWLERRGIIIGQWPPDELCFTAGGTFVKVERVIKNGHGYEALARVADSQDWLYSWEPPTILRLPASSLYPRRRMTPWAKVEPVEMWG